MTEGHKKIFSVNSGELGLHVSYRGPISDNGTSNPLKSPLTTDLTTLGHIFGIKRQNSIRIML